MKRGEIWWVDFEPARGSETRKHRPAVIVSNDDSNAAQSRVQVIPLTSNAARVFPWEAAITVSGRRGKAMADQIRTVSKNRLSSLAGSCNAREMTAVENALRFQLGV